MLVHCPPRRLHPLGTHNIADYEPSSSAEHKPRRDPMWKDMLRSCVHRYLVQTVLDV